MPELTGFLTDFVLGRLLEWALNWAQEAWEVPTLGVLTTLSAQFFSALRQRAAAIRPSRAVRVPPRHE